MRTLIIPDTHIASEYLDELDEIFEEVFQIKADQCIHVGDFYNLNKLNPEELAFGTELAQRLNKHYKLVYMLSGNGRHEWLNGHNIISYLESIGIRVKGMEMELEIDGKKCFFGHGMTNQSRMEYGSHEYTVKELRKYDIALLGHQHQFQHIEGNIYHIGSIFYQHFNEATDECKYVAMIEDGKLTFIPLKSPIKMYDVHDAKELPNIPKKAKVRLVIKSFEEFKKQVDNFGKWKDNFHTFQYKLDFKPTVTKKTDKPVTKQSSKEIITDELNQIEDKDVRTLLKEQFAND